MRLVATSMPAVMSAMAATLTAGSEGTPSALAIASHAHRPAPSPRGMPARQATQAKVVAVAAMVVESCRRTQPSVSRMAKSRRRRRTEVRARGLRSGESVPPSTFRSCAPHR